MEEKRHSDLIIDEASWNDVKNSGFKWIDFYTKFATKLLSYKNDRAELIKKIQHVYDNVGSINFPKLDSDGQVIDIDPFTVFGLFNKQSFTKDNRRLLINEMANEFEINTVLSDMNARIPFAGIPFVNNINAVFYPFKEHRGKDDIDNLWDVFETALALSENETTETRKEFIKRYDIVHGQYNIKWNITMGLYWIRPYFFLNLDQRSRWFIKNTENMPVDFVALAKEKMPNDNTAPKAEDYLIIQDACKKALDTGKYIYKTIPELSYASWFISEKVNQESAQKRRAGENALADKDVNRVHYWTYSPGRGAEKWDEFYKEGIIAIGWGEIGDLLEFSSKDEIKQAMKDEYGDTSSYKNRAHAAWQFSREMAAGDIIYAKRGRNEIIGRGVVLSDYEYNDACSDDFNNVRFVKWTDCGSWEAPSPAAMKTLTDITPYTEYVNKLESFFKNEEDDDVDSPVKGLPSYSRDDFLDKVYMDG